MLIQLTNASIAYHGNPILINTDMIVSIHRGTRMDNEGNEDTVTFIFMPPHGTWEVQETPEQILKLIKR